MEAVRSWWHELVRVHPRDDGHWAAVRVTLAVCLPLATLLALDRPDWVGYAVFGSLSVVFGREASLPARLRLQLGGTLAMTFAVVLGVAVGVLAPGSVLAVLAAGVVSAVGAVLALARGLVPGPSLFMVFATGTLASYRQDAGDLVAALICSSGAGMLGVLLGQVGSGRGREVAKRPFRELMGSPRDRHGILVHAVGPLLAGGLATLFGIGHPYWAAVAATVPLVGATATQRWGRAGLRIGGTVVGIAAAGLVLAFHPPVWVLVLVVAVAQTGTELWVRRNYGIAVAFITPVALILSQLAAPSSVTSLLYDRVVETLLGVGVSVALLLILPAPAVP